MEGRALISLRPHIGFTGAQKCHQWILKEIHQEIEEAKVQCHSGATKSLALCLGVKGVK